MMRVLRSSLYPSLSAPPITTIVRDMDVVDSLESVALSAPHPGALVLHDIFKMPNGSIEEASREAMRRFHLEQRRERDMAILFHWSLMNFSRIRTGGVLFLDKPAPLRANDMEYVFNQLKEEASYDGFRLTGFDCNQRMVRLHNGEVDIQ